MEANSMEQICDQWSYVPVNAHDFKKMVVGRMGSTHQHPSTIKSMITSMPANGMLNLSKLIKTLSRINYISSFFTLKARKIFKFAT